jgi:hypothetical protein
MTGPEPDSRYCYYLHGKIVEDLGPSGVSSRFGAYDYHGIVAALEAEGLAVISEVRAANTDPSAYADRLLGEIQARIRSGIPASHITVLGSSKGAVIASLVSARLQEDEVRYVFIAYPAPALLRQIGPSLTGEILSIYEASDDIGHSCAEALAEATSVRSFEEIRLETGLGHGIQFRPIPEWVEPAAAWAKC